MSVLVKQAGIISAADFLRLFVKTLIGVLLARILTQADFGTYRQLFMIYTLISSIFMIGLPQSVYYFLPKSDDETKKKFLKQTVDVFTVLGFLGSLLILLSRHGISAMFHNQQLSKILIIYALYPFFMFLSQLYYSVMIGMQKPKKAAAFVIFQVVCDFVLILGTAIITKSLVFITAGMVFSVFIQWLYARISLNSISPLNRSIKYDKELLVAQFKFALPIGVASIIGIVSSQIDKLVISTYFTPELFAVFSVGAAELPFIGIITNSVNAVILPEMSKKTDAKSVSELYRGAVRKNALILFPLFAFCFVFAPQIIQILYSAKYLNAVIFFRIYLLTMPLRIATYGLLFQVFNKTKYIFMISLIALISNTGLSLMLINLYGLKGPAISTTLVTYITIILYVFLIKTKLNLKLTDIFPLSALSRTILASAFTAIICYPIILLNIDYLWQFITGLLCFLGIYFVLGNLFKAILPYDNNMVKSIIKDVIKKIKEVRDVQ